MPASMAELEALVAAATTLTQKVDALNDLAFALDLQEPSRCLALAQQAIKLARMVNYVAGMAKGEAILGMLHIRHGHLDQAMLHYTNVLLACEKLVDRQGIASALINIGFLHYSLGDYASAQQVCLKSIEQAHGVASALESQALNNAGLAYMETGDFSTALDYLLQSLTLARSINEAKPTAAVLDSLADLYLRMGELPMALEHANASVTLARSANLDFDMSLGISLITLGKIYLAMQDCTQASFCFREAAQISGEVTSNQRITHALKMLGVTYRCQGEVETAITVLQYACDSAVELGTRPLQSDCLFELAKTYKALGNYERALACYEQFHQIKESVFNERADTRFKTLQVVHQVETARKEIELYQIRNVELQREIEQRERAQAALEELATKDFLTGLFNRRHFFSVAAKQLMQAQHYQRPLSIILFDIDHFKLVNDTLGHLTGDEALRIVAAQLRQEVRATDIIARYAGDEFIILLPETNGDQAFQLADRLRTRIEAQLASADGGALQTTISLGVATLTPDIQEIDQMLERADKALYIAKRVGRNNVQHYQTLVYLPGLWTE
jgi:diguanylate cyclase (GGDEF)-like protein